LIEGSVGVGGSTDFFLTKFNSLFFVLGAPAFVGGVPGGKTMGRYGTKNRREKSRVVTRLFRKEGLWRRENRVGKKGGMGEPQEI